MELKQEKVKEPYQVDVRKFRTFPGVKKRFLAKIASDCFEKENEDLCWNWVGNTHSSGYGQIRWDSVTYNAHRMSYIIFNGLIPQGHIVCHTCNNRKCVNPKHLITGTYSDNTVDAIKIGMHRSQKLTEADVKVIKHLLKGKYKRGLSSKISRLFNVDPSAIRAIRKGYSYQWITLEESIEA